MGYVVGGLPKLSEGRFFVADHWAYVSKPQIFVHPEG